MRIRIAPDPCGRPCDHVSYTAPFGQLWSNRPEMHRPHVSCRLYGLIFLDVTEVPGCMGPVAQINAAWVPPECPMIAQPELSL